MKKPTRRAALYLPPEDKTKMEKLSGEVRWLRVNDERQSTETAIAIGVKLLAAEKLVRKTYGKKKGKWGEFRKAYFKGIKPRKSQRCMKLGTIDLEKYPHLKYLSQRRLLRVLDFVEGADVGKLLAKHQIKLSGKVTPKHLKQIKVFRKKVAELIETFEAEKESEKSKGSEVNAREKTPSARTRVENTMPPINQVIKFIDSIGSEEDFEGKITPPVRAKLRMLGGKIRWLFQPIKSDGANLR